MLGEPERDEQQPGLVHMIVVMVDHDNLGLAGSSRTRRSRLAVERPASAAAQNHDPLHTIILRPGRWLAVSAFVLRPG